VKLTKAAIRDAFAQLLDEKPFNKITVNDIAARAGINRNSFYYHFQDIPSLLEEIIIDDFNSIIEKYPTVDSAEECFDFTLRFALENRRAVMHIYKSVSRDVYEGFLWRICDYSVRTYINSAIPVSRISSANREAITNYYKCFLFGVVSYWLENGMNEDMLDEFERLNPLQKKQFEEMIRFCESENNA